MKIKETFIRIKDAADDRLRSFCGALTPEKRLAAILILVFGAWAGWYLRTGEESPIGPGTTLAEISWPDGQKSVRVVENRDLRVSDR